MKIESIKTAVEVVVELARLAVMASKAVSRALVTKITAGRVQIEDKRGRDGPARG